MNIKTMFEAETNRKTISVK